MASPASSPETHEMHGAPEAAGPGGSDGLGGPGEPAEDIPRPLTGLLFKMSHLYRQAMAERLKGEEWLVDVGFRPPCMGAMMAIAAHQPLSQRELSAKLGVDPSDLVNVIDIIERAGFVSRQRDPRDRRRHLLIMTPQGWSATRRLRDILGDVDDTVLSPLSAEQRRLLRRLLEGVVTHHV